jgi:hypothetical protein
MNTATNKILLYAGTALVTGVAIGAVLYYRWDTVAELAECAMYDKNKAENLHKLRKIRVALRTYECDLKATEESAKSSAARGESISPATRNAICGLSIDFDFILASLDKVEGDAEIKKERKRLVDEFKSFSKRVDVLEGLAR